MADGSLRIEVEVEPKDAQAAFALFGRPGAPMALAALKEGYAAVGNEPKSPKPEEKPKGGLLSQWAAMRCAEEPFQKWIASEYPAAFEDIEGPPLVRAAILIRKICSIRSRAELDHDTDAAELFRKYILHPWQKHYLTQHA